MDYTISKDRLLRLIKTMLNLVKPNFSSENAMVATYSDGDDTYIRYYNKDKKSYHEGQPETFARYYVWKKELVLDMDLFLTLEDYFGSEGMTFIIDWFNDEFEQDAEFVTF